MEIPESQQALARRAAGLSAVLTFVDQRQNGSNRVLEFCDPADDGCRGPPRLPCRVLDQGVLRLLEAVKQRSEINGSVVHPIMLGRTALSLGKRAQCGPALSRYFFGYNFEANQ